MMAASLQSRVLRFIFMLFISLLSSHHVSADLVVRESLDIEQYITPRLFSPREAAVSSSNFTFQLQERSFLAQRQSSRCDPGFGYCSSNGGCCPSGSGCCKASCTEPEGKCCANGISCPAGYGCCDALNIGNDGCAPLGGSCCRNSEICNPGWVCCNDSVGGCAPADGECCKGYGYCDKGNRCVLYRGLPSCCPGGICAGSGNSNGQALSSQPPAVGDSADAPVSTGKPRVTLEQTETAPEITIENLSITAQAKEPTSTEEAFPFPSSELSLPSIVIPSVSIPSIIIPSISIPSISIPSISFPSISIPSITSELSGVAKVGQALSMGTSKVRTASWVVLGVAFFVSAALKF